MKLKDFLKKEQITGDVCIGSKTSFVYIGAADLDDISNAFNEYLKKTKRQLAHNEREIRSLIMTIPIIKDTDDKEKIIFGRARSIKNKYDMIMRNRQYISKFTPVSNREVKEHYRRVTDGALVIIVSGMENGDYWLKSEVV